jgi:hypothetical protein
MIHPEPEKGGHGKNSFVSKEFPMVSSGLMCRDEPWGSLQKLKT